MRYAAVQISREGRQKHEAPPSCGMRFVEDVVLRLRQAPEPGSVPSAGSSPSRWTTSSTNRSTARRRCSAFDGLRRAIWTADNLIKNPDRRARTSRFLVNAPSVSSIGGAQSVSVTAAPSAQTLWQFSGRVFDLKSSSRSAT